MPVILASGASASTADFLVAWFVVGLIGVMVLSPFSPRKIGGAKGGSEKAYIGAIWVLAGIVAGLYMATAGSSAAVG